MTILVTKQGNKHIKKQEIGKTECPNCGSELQAERSDFKRVRAAFPHDAPEPYLECPICKKELRESEFAWTDVNDV